MPVHKGIKVAAVNRKARHDYFIEDTLECGIALTGTEVKSIRKGSLNLKDGYAMVKNGQLHLYFAVLEIDGQGNEAVALGLLEAIELGDLTLMGQKRPCPERVMVEDVALLIGTDMDADELELTVLHHGIAILQVQ